MTALHDTALLTLIGGVITLLIVASLIGWVLSRRTLSQSGRATVDNINARIRAWWVMAFIFVIAVATGGAGSILLFALLSFLALREFVTLAPTSRGDHRALFWCFFIVTPLQYLPCLGRLVRPLRQAHSCVCLNLPRRPHRSRR